MGMTENQEKKAVREDGKKLFDIQEELKKLPPSPGVYIMHDRHDEIIYVGKAKNLRRLGAIAPTLSSAVVYRGEDFPIIGGGSFVNFQRFSEYLDSLCDTGEEGENTTRRQT